MYDVRYARLFQKYGVVMFINIYQRDRGEEHEGAPVVTHIPKKFGSQMRKIVRRSIG
jgi:hypothetical protein